MTGIFWLDWLIFLAVVGPLTYWGIKETAKVIYRRE